MVTETVDSFPIQILETQSTIGETTFRTITFFTLKWADVNPATLDTVVDHSGTLDVVDVPISPVVVKPETEKQKEPRPQIEQEKDIHIQTDHRCPD